MTRCLSCFVELSPPGAEMPKGRRFAPVPAHPTPVGGECRCGATVPDGWDHPSVCIAMAGARTTGKSIYAAVMIKQLEQHAARMGMTVRPASKDVAAAFTQNYLKPLYEQRSIMPPTPSLVTDNAYQREPLVFDITTTAGRLHKLVIRDVAGENLENPEDVEPRKLSFFENADAVFFLYDPLKVPQIRYKLRGLLSEGTLGEDPGVVLANTLSLVGRGTPKLAVIMSKFDILQTLRKIEGGGEWATIMRNPGGAIFRDFGPGGPPNGADGTPNDADGEQLHEEVRSLLIKLEANALVRTVERAAGQSDRHRFFAVSALGDAPKGKSLTPQGIAPFRCLDPLRWACAGMGIL